MRRAAVPVAANIVGGCARRSPGDFLCFLDISFGSARELNYYKGLSQRLKCLLKDSGSSLSRNADEASRILSGLCSECSSILSTREPKNQETSGFTVESEDGSSLTAHSPYRLLLVQRDGAAWTTMASADSRRSEDEIGLRR